MTIHADASIYAGLIDGAEQATFALPKGRLAYVHVARGALTVNGGALPAGSGANDDQIIRLHSMCPVCGLRARRQAASQLLLKIPKGASRQYEYKRPKDGVVSWCAASYHA